MHPAFKEELSLGILPHLLWPVRLETLSNDIVTVAH